VSAFLYAWIHYRLVLLPLLNHPRRLLHDHDLLLPQRCLHGVRICEDLINFFQRAAFRLDEEEVDEDDANQVYRKVQEVETLSVKSALLSELA
jgi:hypothetical protein